MQPEKNPSLMLELSDAPRRPWQFSIRGLMALTFVASILFTLMGRYGYHGFLALVSLLAIALFVAGIILNRNQYIVGGILLFFASFGKIATLVIMIGCGLYVLSGSLIIGGEWFVRQIYKCFDRS